MANNRSDRHQNDLHSTKKSTSKIILVSLIIVSVIVIGAGLGFLTASIHSMPSLKNDIKPPAASQIYDSKGNLINTIAVENRVPVSLNKIPKDLQNAFIATEDARFYQHMGIDPRGIFRAILSNITDRGVSEGGSTITQQLAKNAVLTQEQTLKRKIQEAVVALQIEQQYTKSEILELYLNHIYFGQGAYGVQAAAKVYFGKNVEDLNLAECTMLAGIPKSPNYYSPLNNFKAATERQGTVINQMVKYGYIDEATAAKTRNTKIKLAPPPSKSDKDNFASYFVDYVTQYLIDKYGADAVYKDGLKVYTTLDSDMQTAAEQAMQKLPTMRTDSNGIKQPQGALVAIDPKSGAIKAMVGGRGSDQFNRAVLAERQPGSAFKPFVYLAAIESGMSPSTRIDDSPISFGDWSPSNYDNRYHGQVTLRTALEQSLNIPTVKITNQIGLDKPLYYAQQMGISTLVLKGPNTDRNLAMSLGGLTRGVTPLELASAYGVFANRGVHVEPTPIIKVVDRNGKILEQQTIHEKAIINERSAYTITDMMKGVITRGTGTAANINRPAAGKTGTTNDYKDAWFVGFTPDLVAAVWMGCDNEGTLNNITGGSTPARIWNSFMTQALAHIPAHDFVRPDGVAVDNTYENIESDNEQSQSEKPKSPDDKNSKNHDSAAPTTANPANPNDKHNEDTPAKPDSNLNTPPPPNKPTDPNKKNNH